MAQDITGVWFAIPNKAAHQVGLHPVLYMLDGNAVMDRLPENAAQTAGRPLAAGVAIGYRT